jgi:hypothetical protein
MKKSILCGALLAVAAFAMTSPASAAIRWGFGDPWADTTPADGGPDGWGTFNLSFVNIPPVSGEDLAQGTVGALDVWGKTYYGTGVATSELAVNKFLYLETFDIQGDMKIEVSGAGDVDIFNLTTAMISYSGVADPRNPAGTVIFNPGQYVFDLTQWAPLAAHSNIQVQLVAQGGTGSSFTVNRVFISDINPLAPVPEMSSWLMLSIGLVGVAGLVRSKLNK